eukprot:TRINITY_DN1609_c1_g1_i1.p1 TRINITY_DN1609_c1_g1~~TRINITY_DN1609_c1_g1_i1.p1  ORF type:complete len:698 (+),score=337.39 TRINITY_DN1609_c1_g1_i1:91-2184(+)
MAPKMIGAAALALTLAPALAETSQAKGAALQKVVVMLTDMAARCKEDKQKEEVGYASWKQWCGDQTQSLTAQIAESGEQIESLTAEVGKLGSDATTLGEEVMQLEKDLTKYEADKKEQEKQRASEHKEFLAEQKDYGESVDAIDRAVAVLQKQNYDRSALLQMSESEQLPVNARSMIAAFVGLMGDDDGDSGFLSRSAPEANAYEFQSGGIVEMLKKLRDEFAKKKADIEKEEMNSKHAHDMVVQDLTDSIAQAKEDSSSKSQLRSSKMEKKSLLQKQLGQTTSMKAEDEKTLSDTKVECSEQTQSFEEKQQLRAEEIQALEKAIEILAADNVQVAGEKHLALAAQKASVQKAAALVQLNTDSEGIRRRLRDFLEAQSQKLHSQNLGLLAEKLAADPFAKVKKMIDEMITRLLNEANADAEHEGFCDKEMGESKITRTKLQEDIDGLAAAVESGKATISLLAQDVARLSKEVAELDHAVKEATTFRSEEKEQNEATIKDAMEAQTAVAEALAVLKDFYAKAMTATAFVQKPTIGSEEWNSLANPDAEEVDRGHKDGMQTFGDVYTGRQEEAGGILAMIEVIASDFATLEADTKASEATAQASYEEFMAESKKDKAVKSRKIEMSKSDKTSAENKLREDTSDMKFTQDKLLAAERYYSKLEPQCVDKGQTFNERTASRQEEIQSLKEALRILEGEDIA